MVSNLRKAHAILFDSRWASFAVSVADRRRIIYKQLTAARPGRAETPFVELVKRLQESLSKSEKFEVEVPLSSSRGESSSEYDVLPWN